MQEPDHAKRDELSKVLGLTADEAEALSSTDSDSEASPVVLAKNDDDNFF